jgi:hypothetical protein
MTATAQCSRANRSHTITSNPATYGLMIDGAILSQPYDAITGFIAEHPDA